MNRNALFCILIGLFFAGCIYWFLTSKSAEVGSQVGSNVPPPDSSATIKPKETFVPDSAPQIRRALVRPGVSIKNSPKVNPEPNVNPKPGPTRTGVVVLEDRIDRFVKDFDNGVADDGISIEVTLLGESFPVTLTEFDRVPGMAASGVFFGKIDGQPHSRVSWAFHGNAEVAEFRIHGHDTLKILPSGEGREHRVLAWDPKDLGNCALCLEGKH